MKTVPGFKLRKLVNDHILVAEGINLVDFNKMISFNPTAAYLWESVEGKEFTVEDLTKLLTDRYDVSEEVAAADSKAIADEWVKQGIVEE